MRYLLLIIGCIVLLSGCTTRFIADFEADSAGVLPDTMPAGLPDDQIFVLNVGSGNVSVSNTNPITDSQSLLITGPSSGEADGTGNKIVYMYGDSINSNDKTLYANWIGRTTQGATTKVQFFGGHFAILIEIEFEGGDIKVFGNTIGTYTANQEHSVLLNVNPVTNIYNVSVLGRGVSSGSTASGSISDESALPTDNIGLIFTLIAGGSTDYYQLDTVRMSERNP